MTNNHKTILFLSCFVLFCITACFSKGDDKLSLFTLAAISIGCVFGLIMSDHRKTKIKMPINISKPIIFAPKTHSRYDRLEM